MQKAAAWVKLHKNSVLFLICLVFLLSELAGKVSAYETGDDIFINLIGAGAFGAYRQYLVYPNVIWGYLQWMLNALFPSVPCYYVSMLVCNLAAIFALCHVICARLSLSWSIVMTTAVNFVLCTPYYTSLQYTKNVFLYTVAGGLLLFVSLRRDGTGRQYAGAVLLLFLGYIVRDKSFLFMMPFLFLLLPFALWENRKTLNDLSSAEKKRLIVRLLIPFAACLAAFAVNAAHYASGEWQDFARFNRLRGQITDYSGTHYTEHQEAYDAAGITEASLDLLRGWMYDDPETFTPEYLETIERIESADGQHSVRFDTALLRDTTADIIRVCYGNYLGMAFVLCLLGILPGGTNRMRLMALSCAVLLFLEYYYLYCLGRPYFRALIGCWLAAVFVPAVYALETQKMSDTASDGRKRRLSLSALAGKAAPFALAASLMLLAVYPAKQIYNLHTRKGGQFFTDTGSNDAVFHAMRNDTTHFYVGFENYINDDPWQITAARYEGFFENYCSLGDWYAPSPLSRYYAAQNGIENPLRALLTEKNVRLFGEAERAGAVYRYLCAVFPDRHPEMVSVGDRIWQFR